MGTLNLQSALRCAEKKRLELRIRTGTYQTEELQRSTALVIPYLTVFWKPSVVSAALLLDFPAERIELCTAVASRALALDWNLPKECSPEFQCTTF